jgi:thiamine kinase-like enzyme
MTSIPSCLELAALDGRIYYFVQTTQKTLRSKTVFTFSTQHKLFLQQLHKNTKVSLPYEQTDFYTILKGLELLLQPLDDGTFTTVLHKIMTVNKALGQKDFTFSMYHGDFTPWNMIMEQNALFVFDWEYAKRSFPPYLDVFHFFTQTAIHKQKRNAQAIYARYKNREPSFAQFFKDPKLAYQQYLLGVMGIFLLREEQALDKEAILNIAGVWIDLITLLDSDDA